MAYTVRPYQYYDVTMALCSQCLRRVDAKVVFQDGNVYLDKRCPDHGPERVLLSDDIDYYRRSREIFMQPGGMPNVRQTEISKGCPFDCGLCPDHEQHTCVAVLEVTDHCTLRCPVCYAASGPERPEYRSLEQIRSMLETVARSEDKLNVLQISGGEPTLHPDFFAILDLARTFPVRHLMVNTNGLRIARDRAFVERLATYMPDFEIYLQFDSLQAEALQALRGADLRQVHEQALANLSEFGISTTLVVTLARGINDSEVGEIIRFAVAQPSVRGITFQPVQLAGRFEHDVEKRLTISEVRKAIYTQSGIFRPEDVIPVPCHSESLSMAYAFKVGGGVMPLTGLIEPRILIEAGANTIAYEHDPEVGARLFAAFAANHSPSSNAAALRELLACFPDNCNFGELTYANVFRVMIVQFMDAHNLDARALKRSCVHIIHPDGRLIPFDTFNIFHRQGGVQR